MFVHLVIWETGEGWICASSIWSHCTHLFAFLFNRYNLAWTNEKLKKLQSSVLS